MSQPDLFQAPARLPAGFRYATELITAAEEQGLVRELEELPFKEFEFHGLLGKRRIVSFGWRYDLNHGGLQKTEDMPDFLLAIRDRAADFASLTASALQQVLLTEYRPGAAIGWHKDRSVFGEVVGVSLLLYSRNGLVVSRVVVVRRAFCSSWKREMPWASNARATTTSRSPGRCRK